jgi:hypothetical protein
MGLAGIPTRKHEGDEGGGIPGEMSFAGGKGVPKCNLETRRKR